MDEQKVCMACHHPCDEHTVHDFNVHHPHHEQLGSEHHCDHSDPNCHHSSSEHSEHGGEHEGGHN